MHCIGAAQSHVPRQILCKVHRFSGQLDLDKAPPILLQFLHLLFKRGEVDVPCLPLPSQSRHYSYHAEWAEIHCQILGKQLLHPTCAWFPIVTLDPCTGIEIVEDHRRLSTRSLEAAMPLPWIGSTTGKSLAPLPGTWKAGSVAKRFKVSEASCPCWRCWANSNSWRTSASLICSIMCCSNSLTEFMTKISTDQPCHADQPQETFFLSQPATGRGAGMAGRMSRNVGDLRTLCKSH